MRSLAGFKKRILIEYKGGVLEYYSSLKLLYAHWHGLIAPEDVHKSGEVFFHYLKETKAELLLINQKEIKGTWVQSNEWLLKSWLPLVLKTSLKKISFVSSEDDFGKYSLLKFIEKIDQIDINAFSNFDNALAWLLKKETKYKIEKYRQSISRENEKEVDKLKKLLTEKKIYRKNDLTLTDVAKMLKLNPKQFSLILNKIFQKNFNELVNEFRIKEIISNLESGISNNLTIWGIAQESGFNSRASFYRAFKKVTHQSPTQYLSNRKKNLPL